MTSHSAARGTTLLSERGAAHKTIVSAMYCQRHALAAPASACSLSDARRLTPRPTQEACGAHLLHLEYVLVEVLLQLLIGQVDAELLKVVFPECFKACACPASHIQVGVRLAKQTDASHQSCCRLVPSKHAHCSRIQQGLWPSDLLSLENFDTDAVHDSFRYVVVSQNTATGLATLRIACNG